MAEGRTNNSSSSCWFFANYGSCRQGDDCPYPHIAATGPLACRYYQQGRCMFGRNCRNLHSGVARRTSESSDDSDVPTPRRPANSRPSPSLRGKPSSHPEPTLPSTPASSGSSNNSSETTATVVSPWNLAGSRRKGRGGLTRNPLVQTVPSTSSSPSSKGTTSTSALRKQASSSDSGLGEECAALPRPPSEWVQAPEFVPTCAACTDKSQSKGPKSYAEVVNPKAHGASWHGEKGDRPLCPYAEMGECKNADGECQFLHGEVCDLCNKPCLHPFDENQRKRHKSDCVKQHEKDMELSFAVARSKDKMCGICFEVIMEKTPREQRFGILPNCNHCFCLGCIRTWRQAKQFENNITRACPECRVTSDFVCPSMYWVDTKEDKEKLITDYKGALSTKDCKYFKKGEGKCPFGNKCFYQHVLPDGSRIDVGPPSRQRRHNADGDMDVLQHIILWDFLEERDAHILYLDELDLDDSFFTDSDFSDSDIEFMF